MSQRTIRRFPFLLNSGRATWHFPFIDDNGRIRWRFPYRQVSYDNGGGGTYVAQAVHFDGANTALVNLALASTDGGTVSFSFWIYLASEQGGREMVAVEPQGAYLTEVDTQNAIGNKYNPQMFFWNATRTEHFSFSNATNGGNYGMWHNVVGSVKTDLAVGNKIQAVYLDDILLDFAISDISAAFNTAFNGLSFYLGDDGYGDGATFDLADFWWAPNVSLLSGSTIPEATRRLFIDASGKPVYLGASGELPTGTPPAVFFSGDASSFATNKGTGGPFTLTGSLTNASTSPSDPEVYHADAVHFDNGSLLSPVAEDGKLVGVVDSAFGFISTFVRMDSLDTNDAKLFDNETFIVALSPANQWLHIELADEPYDNWLYADTAADTVPANTWLHVLIAWDMGHAAGTRKLALYVNDAPVSFILDDDEGVAFTVGLANLDPVQVTNHGGFPGTNDWADYGFWNGVNIIENDGTISEVNRRKFVDADGKPVDPSNWPADPLLKFSGDATGFVVNQGSGGEFVVVGDSVTNATTSPSD